MKNAVLLTSLFFFLVAPAMAAEPIKIGEMMPYTNGTQYAEPFRTGYQLALEEINAAGGIKGRPLEVVSRDDQANPAVAVRVAEDLVARDHVVMLVGAGFDNVGLAVGSFANRNHVPFLKQWAGRCDAIESKSNAFWFSTTPCYTPYAAVFAREAAKKPFKRWATIAPNYEFGRVMVTAFEKELKRLRPDVTFVAERWPATGKINAAAETRALDKAQPEAIFSCIFGPDLGAFLQYAQQTGFLKDKFAISGTNIGSQMAIREYGAVYPEGWLTEGVPAAAGSHPIGAFYEKYAKKYGHKPDLMAASGYQMLLLVAEALRRAPTLSASDIRTALETVAIDGPLGRVAMKDKQLYTGWWLGFTHNENGQGAFVRETWYPPEVLFPEAFQKIKE